MGTLGICAAAATTGRIKVWPGLLTENIVQAVAADCLRGTLRRLESGHDKRMVVRLHTHDEVLVEVNQLTLVKLAPCCAD